MNAIVKVPFHGDEIQALKKDAGAWLPLKPLCQRFGVDVEGQRKKLKGLAWAVTEIISATGADGKTYEMACLELRSLAGWLFSIHPSKVAPEVRDALVRYQREAADVLYRHFLGAPKPAPQFDGTAELGHNRVFAKECKRLIHRAAEIEGLRWAKVHGELRIEFRAVSYLRMPLKLWELAERWLLARITTAPIRPQLVASKRQLGLFGDTEPSVH